MTGREPLPRMRCPVCDRLVAYHVDDVSSRMGWLRPHNESTRRHAPPCPGSNQAYPRRGGGA